MTAQTLPSYIHILLCTIAGVFLLLSCHRTILASDAWAMTATNTPDHFLEGRFNGWEMSEPEHDKRCHNPMIDPRDSTKIYLFRSFDGRGDYEVPEGKYGVQKGQILRLDCTTGRVVGIFKK
jgi:hypothetical protein